MDNLTVIIPVHSTHVESFDEYLKKALDSIDQSVIKPSHTLLVAGDENVKNDLNTFTDYNFDVVVNDGNTNYQAQVNFGINHVKTEYFTVLEFDDAVSPIYFSNLQKYLEAYGDEVDIFVPLIKDVNEDGEFVGFSNDAAWAYEFTQEHGLIDLDTLKDYPNFSPNGIVMRVEDYKDIGGFKENIVFTFNYEFLMRATYYNYKIMVIPKIGYIHTNMRKGSLFYNFKYDENQALNPDQAKYWMEKAQNEYYFTQDREID